MYGLAENRVMQPHQENGREIVAERPTSTTGEDRETMPYVVRDLSWELARYLDAQDTTKEGR